MATIIVREVRNSGGTPDVREVRERYIKRRKAALGHQCNPLQTYLELLLKRSRIPYVKSGVPCALSGIQGLSARSKKITGLYQLTINETIYWVKIIAGYDGVKDKTREMAARARLLQYESPNANRRTVNLIIVTDGLWSEDLQKLLSLSGWNRIVPVLQFGELIESLRSYSKRI